MTTETPAATRSQRRIPLFAKILLWFFLNILLLAAVLAVLARGQFHFGLDTLVSGPAGKGVHDVARLITGELRERNAEEWPGVLNRYAEVYHVQFFLIQAEKHFGGTNAVIPEEVLKRCQPPRFIPPPDQDRPRSGGDLVEPQPRNLSQGPPPENPDFGPPRGHESGQGQNPGEQGHMLDHISMMRTESPVQYWVFTRTFVPGHEHPSRPVATTLLISSGSITGNGLFFDAQTWIIGGSAVIIISVLFWLPLVGGITRALTRMTRATEKIARGDFNVRTHVNRRDELGALSEAIDRMALRLSGYVSGQKRFLGDIAHELCSPIARLQFALGILEQRADENLKNQVADLREEVEQISALVNELLSFSKATMGSRTVELKSVAVTALVEKTIARESTGNSELKIRSAISGELQVQGDFDLLLRALGNILRNAIKYAGADGEIIITAKTAGDIIEICVEDSGPGIPAEALEKVFDPFYRVDASRDRETGGVGLGLSIVKTCVESCGGRVRCENKNPKGLRVIISLMAVGE
jgi:two-component system sensor histidine kinase CpxA